MKEKQKVIENMQIKTALHVLFVAIFSGLIAFLSILIIRKNLLLFLKEVQLFFCLWLIVFILVLSQSLYVNQMRSKKGAKKQALYILYVTNLLTVVFSFIVISLLNSFAIPIAITSILVSILISRREGVVSTIVSGLIVLSCAVVLGSNERAPMLICSFLVSMFSGCYMIDIAKRNCSRFKLVVGCAVVAIVIFPITLLASFAFTSSWVVAALNGMWAVVGNLAALVIATAILPIFETVFNVWTDFRIAEQCRFDHPIMKELSDKAPGTFNHCLVVGNLAENCAIAIGENPYKARIAAYYHDIGKIKNPEFFVENQTGYNPHDDLIPEVSVNMITMHTFNGYEILKKYRIPDEIARVTVEHHGTSPVLYFYLKAQDITEGHLNMKSYCYDNPKPSTKIAAIIMICDVIEAAARSLNANTYEDLAKFVENVVKEKIISGQFDNCAITMKDLAKIKDTILKALPAINHKRINYKTAPKYTNQSKEQTKE